jgi:hypothetical protein
MKKIQLVMTVVGGVLLCQSAKPVVFWSEQFVNYSDGRLADAGIGANSGVEPTWQTARAEVTVTNANGSLLGNSLGLVASLGTRASLAANTILTNNGTYCRFVVSGTFRPDRQTNIYTSFLYRFNDASQVSTEGQPFSAMNRQNSGITTPSSFSWYLFAKRVGANVQLGLTRSGNPNQYAATTNYATTNIASGETIFVVVRQQVIPNATTNDIIDLWINPPADSFGADEASVPLPSVSTSDGVDDTSNTGPGRFWIMAYPNGASAEIDEIRVANNWAEATPPVGQCLTAAIVADPVSVSQVAEINATFKVVAGGTGPTYQWQASTNSGTSWNNIVGATFASYTTPNLSLPQSGTQYRAIVRVACDASSVTSSVATVTLTAPILTLTGLVMNDTFLDPDLGYDDRSNLPLTSSNSLWYTSVTDDLIAYNQGGNMLGIPAAGSSRLWLGYFIDTNQPPVHLGIGRTIKVTLPFIANSFNSFTNNAALRFGLFDYYDGGTRFLYDTNTASGSGGNGNNVRGYMLSLDWGQIFSANSPLQLLSRIALADNNLMGTTGAYQSLGSGPAGGGYSNAPAFAPGTLYTLTFSVTRIAENSVIVTANITGGTLNLTHTVTETNSAYHRFDAFGLRPNSLETSADGFTFPEFIVEVLSSAIQVAPFSVTSVQALSFDSIKLTWTSVVGASYQILSSPSLASPTWTTNGTVLATGSSTSYTNTPTSGTERYYRIVGLPYTP